MAETANLKELLHSTLLKLGTKGVNTTDCLWQLMSEFEDNANKDNVHIDDEKKKENNSSTSYTLSSLIDFKNKRYITLYGMCLRGHFLTNGGWSKSDKCLVCKDEWKVVRRRMVCNSCLIENNRKEKYKYLYCLKCGQNNTSKVKNIWQCDENKRNIINRVLTINPSLSLDLLCGLPRAAALRSLLNEIVVNGDFASYCLYLIDLDDFKAINSMLGHDGADKVIIDIAQILKEYMSQANGRKWNKKCGIEKVWAFRQGGDEMALVVKNNCFPNKHGSFYRSWKRQINDLGQKYLNTLNDENKADGIKTVKDRTRKKMEEAMKGLDLKESTKLEIYASIKTQNVNKRWDNIGISVGMYSPCTLEPSLSTDDWLDKAERAQNEVKKCGKNDIRIYVEWKRYNKKEYIVSDSWFKN